ncbi:MAG: hypothetical protein ABFS43_18845 [Thermodesulfobacteriota bacterium]
MILKPQDVVILLKLVAIGKENWSFSFLSTALYMSPSEVHAGVHRTIAARLAVKTTDRIKPAIRSLEEFLIHGLRYVFVPDRGEITRGMPTLHAGPPLSQMLVSSNDPPPVWPDPEGNVRGQSFLPLYKSVPKAARQDRQLYELLVLADALRGGRQREREIAMKEISKRLKDYNDSKS